MNQALRDLAVDGVLAQTADDDCNTFHLAHINPLKSAAFLPWDGPAEQSILQKKAACRSSRFLPSLFDAYCPSRKLLSLSARLGWRSLRQALASICLMRSRVTSNCLPTSSSVCSVLIWMPKLMHKTLASRRVI